MSEKMRPGEVRDAIRAVMAHRKPMKLRDIHTAVVDELGRPVATSSVRSYLRLNSPETFAHVARGQYKLIGK